jgi:hypothetical protein
LHFAAASEKVNETGLEMPVDPAASSDKFYLERRMRAFVYLSSAKLAPLYDWIGEPVKKRIALTLGISLPVLPVKVEAQVRPSATSDIDKLAIVLAHLDGEGDIGTVDDPRGYFAGRLELRWAAAKEFVFLSGSTNRTVVVLTGSNRHMLTHFESEPGNVSLPGSSTVGVSRTLDQILADAEKRTDEEDFNLVARLAVRRRRGPKETLEFVARKLAYEDVFVAAHDYRPAPDFEHLRDREVKVLHGTPLYLASID